MSKRNWMGRVLVVTIFVFVTCLAGSKAMGEPVFNPDGSITCRNNGIVLDKNGVLTINAGNVKISGRMQCLCEIDPVTEERRWFYTSSLEDKSLEVDIEKKQTIFKGTYTHKGTGNSLDVSISVSLDNEGMVKVEREFSTPELFKDGILGGGGYLYLKSPYDNFIGETVKVGERVINFNKGGKPEPVDVRGNPDKIIFFADNPSMRITFFPLGTDGIHFTFTEEAKNVHLSLHRFKVDLGIKE